MVSPYWKSGPKRVTETLSKTVIVGGGAVVMFYFYPSNAFDIDQDLSYPVFN